jgi:hypothetical protein
MGAAETTLGQTAGARDNGTLPAFRTSNLVRFLEESDVVADGSSGVREAHTGRSAADNPDIEPALVRYRIWLDRYLRLVAGTEVRRVTALSAYADTHHHP